MYTQTLNKIHSNVSDAPTILNGVVADGTFNTRTEAQEVLQDLYGAKYNDCFQPYPNVNIQSTYEFMCEAQGLCDSLNVESVFNLDYTNEGFKVTIEAYYHGLAYKAIAKKITELWRKSGFTVTAKGRKYVQVKVTLTPSATNCNGVETSQSNQTKNIKWQ